MRHPTLQRLRSLLHYDPDSGRWTWVVDRGGTARTGKEAGYIHSFSDTQNQRRVLKIDGVFYRASRLAWFYMTGQWPKNLIDHKNGDTLDDRWENLRQATRSQTAASRKRSRNNAAGFKGVFKRRDRNGYWVRIQVNGKRITRGSFQSREAASEAYKTLAIKHYAEFARWD